MTIGTQVLHIEKRISIPSGLNRHITRKQFVSVGGKRKAVVWVPDNADPKRTAGNVELVSREYKNGKGQKYELTLQQAVDKRLREADIKPRKGQTTCLEMIFSGSHEVMANMSKEELRQWAEDTLKWAQEKWGKENVVSASLHVDEKTPHIHMIVVPIVSGQSRRTRNYRMKASGRGSRTYKINHDKLRLCANEVFTQGKLYDYHDSYAKEVSKKYGLGRGEKAEPGCKKKHTNSIEYNRMLATKAKEQEALIRELTSDYDEKKGKIQENIQQLQGSRERLSSLVEEEKKNYASAVSKTKEAEMELASQKETITELHKAIEDNSAIIVRQEIRKASASIDEDAAEQQLLEKYSAVLSLSEEEHKLQRLITDKKTELAEVDANVRNRRAQLNAKINLYKVPQKGRLGYPTHEVERFIDSVNAAELTAAMNKVPGDIKVAKEILDENDRLRGIEDDYMAFKNSSERMRKRIEYLETEAKRKSITEVLGYALQKTVKVGSFSADNTPTGEDIFAEFTIAGNAAKYVGHITPDERVYYTREDQDSLEEVKSQSLNKTWKDLGLLSVILAENKTRDTLARYSTKLSLLVGGKVNVKDYIVSGKEYLLFASNGRAYHVFSNGSTWSTSDSRVKTLKDCKTYGPERIWRKEGNIADITKRGQQLKLKL